MQGVHVKRGISLIKDSPAFLTVIFLSLEVSKQEEESEPSINQTHSEQRR